MSKLWSNNPFSAYWQALQLTLEERGKVFAAPPRGGDCFFMIALLAACISGLTLYLIDGYHTGFLPLNAAAAHLRQPVARDHHVR